MKIRKAGISDVNAIHSLITSYAEQDVMLFRSLADIYEHLQTFTVAEIEENIVGCCALDVIWEDLAEIKSLAVATKHTKSGIGKKLVEAATKQALEIGLPRIFALTMNIKFFEGLGFSKVSKEKLPMKVWKDCARCSKQLHCDEVAVLKKF
ncbi:MAG: N-acetyltransferase [Planctomycetota bacterium]|jgi:amino-acid N-acetyltransferase